MLTLKRRALLLSAFGGTVLTVLGRSPRAAAPAAMTIDIESFEFLPQQATVKAGTMVTWVNRDDSPHTVYSLDESFLSDVMDTDQEFSMVFDKPGEYPYLCSVHPHMKGTVIVTEA
ncbi:cupredoxin family copper-binding protein [Pelagibius sp. CAU 1746]|uniref:cupredoxin domain-containing protein n=1 Tax=Pelagibius sp. CAU 1746 TaxID=3140370 RepID=UPI00325BD942